MLSNAECAGVCDVRQLVTVPVDVPVVHIWRHFAVPTLFHGVTLFQDHLFLVREG